ncbi:MAG: hypothetical protein LAQ69_20610 [Acidobacteriia bacterium]|nr:hypothetical protein [Terriglobia bacterium]
MDVEKTMEFLLEQQARFDARLEAHQAQLAAQQAESDRRFTRIERFIERGARMLASERGARLEIDRKISALVEAQQDTEEHIVQLTESQQRLTESQRQLADAQRQTETSLKAFIDSLRKSGNGQ